MRSIEEVGPGDFVKVGPGRFEKISRIDKSYHPDFPGKVRNWTVITESGMHVSMYEAKSYHKKEDLQK